MESDSPDGASQIHPGERGKCGGGAPEGRLPRDRVALPPAGGIFPVIRDVAVYVALCRSPGCNASPILHEDWDRGGFGVALATRAG